MFEQYNGEVAWHFRVSGEHSAPIQDEYHASRISPEEVSIRWYPEKTTGGGSIRWSAKVTGRVVKKDGTPGKARGEHQWGTWTDHYGEPPAVVAEIVEATRERAERAISGEA